MLELSLALMNGQDTRVSVIAADRDAHEDVGYIRGRARTSGLEIVEAGSTLARVRRSVRGDPRGTTLLHDNGLWLLCNLQAAVAARSHRLPLIISPHGMLEPWALGHQGVRKRIALQTYQKWCLGVAQAFHATSPQEARSVRRLGLRQPIAVVGNGVERPPGRFELAPEPCRTALFLSRLHPKKGALDLVRAWADVRPPGWRLRIVGPDEGGHRRTLAAAIQASQATGSIELCEGTDELQRWDYMAGAELFVLPTYSENFGLVIGEALACGLPVITTDATPWGAISRRGCGWVVPPGAAPLAGALREATALSREVLRSMGARGRQWIPREFSWERIAAQMRQFYHWVAAGRVPDETPEFVQLSDSRTASSGDSA